MLDKIFKNYPQWILLRYSNIRNGRLMGKIIYIIHFCLRVQWHEERLRLKNLNENAWVLQLPGEECQQNTKSFLLSGRIMCISIPTKNVIQFYCNTLKLGKGFTKILIFFFFSCFRLELESFALIILKMFLSMLMFRFNILWSKN